MEHDDKPFPWFETVIAALGGIVAGITLDRFVLPQTIRAGVVPAGALKAPKAKPGIGGAKSDLHLTLGKVQEMATFWTRCAQDFFRFAPEGQNRVINLGFLRNESFPLRGQEFLRSLGVTTPEALTNLLQSPPPFPRPVAVDIALNGRDRFCQLVNMLKEVYTLGRPTDFWDHCAELFYQLSPENRRLVWRNMGIGDEWSNHIWAMMTNIIVDKYLLADALRAPFSVTPEQDAMTGGAVRGWGWIYDRRDSFCSQVRTIASVARR